LLTRRRDPANRRVHVVELTDDGEAAFLRLREAAVAFDRQIRDGVSDEELAGLREILGRLEANVGGAGGGAAVGPGSGAADGPAAAWPTDPAVAP
jgi:MarR family transcriptional regulator for hemolysin